MLNSIVTWRETKEIVNCKRAEVIVSFSVLVLTIRWLWRTYKAKYHEFMSAQSLVIQSQYWPEYAVLSAWTTFKLRAIFILIEKKRSDKWIFVKQPCRVLNLSPICFSTNEFSSWILFWCGNWGGGLYFTWTIWMSMSQRLDAWRFSLLLIVVK